MSPSLFNLVMDSLLTDLKSKDLGLSIQGLFLGAFAHGMTFAQPQPIPMTQMNKLNCCFTAKTTVRSSYQNRYDFTFYTEHTKNGMNFIPENGMTLIPKTV